ncbi:MAG TPA: hypothetical protein VHL09_13465 [Dehalococcoidia bacterium]|nr:hypothetical protein [Dehalococcoidia bacterium]
MVGRNYRFFGVATVATAMGLAIITILNSARAKPERRSSRAAAPGDR